MADPVLDIEGLRYRYPERDREALAGIDLLVEPGEFVVLAGRSGSGKTTLLRAACGLVPHFHGGEVAGRMEVAGVSVREEGPAELARHVGYIAQDPETQVVSTTVRAELGLPLELRGAPADAQGRSVEELALALGIPNLLDRTVDTLSGGELQRVALAAALVPNPALVLLDEPTSQLDPVAGDELISLLRRLNEEWGVAVLLCEHRLERCLPAADRVIAMDAGAITFDGPPPDFLAWAVAHDPALATPAAHMFDAVGLRPLPVGVKSARALLVGAPGIPPRGNRSLRSLPAVDEMSPVPPRAAPEASEIAAAATPGAPLTAGGALRIRDLWVELEGAEVLRGIDLRIGPGERVALMGRNGAGKTTLLRTMAGFVDPVRGRAELPGGVALLPQNPGDMFIRERVGEEFAGGAREAALAAVGLKGMEGRDPRDLSGGERQRLALALVMTGRGEQQLPGAVLLDEPTRGMDRARKDDLSALAGGLAEGGSAVIIATHDIEFAAAFAHRVVLMGSGEIVADGPAPDLLSGGWYFSTEVARVLGEPGVVTAEQGTALIQRATVST